MYLKYLLNSDLLKTFVFFFYFPFSLMLKQFKTVAKPLQLYAVNSG